MPFAIKVIYRDGEEDYLCQGLTDKPAIFPSRSRAKEMVEFLKMGGDEDYQSVNIVPYPKRSKRATP